MVKRLLLVVLLSPWVLGGCTAVSKAKLTDNTSLKKVAVVSLAVSDWGGTVNANAIGRDSVGHLMQEATGKMIRSIEKELAGHWQVKKVDTFIADAKYRKAAEDLHVSTYAPVIKGKEMPLFGAGFKKGDITPEKAKTLCAALHVDAVVLVFSEWTEQTGGMIPITKALSKNVVSFWDKQGEKIYFRRIDIMGRKPLGALGIKAVNAETIGQWTDGYDEALRKMFAAL